GVTTRERERSEGKAGPRARIRAKRTGGREAISLAARERRVGNGRSLRNLHGANSAVHSRRQRMSLKVHDLSTGTPIEICRVREEGGNREKKRLEGRDSRFDAPRRLRARRRDARSRRPRKRADRRAHESEGRRLQDRAYRLLALSERQRVLLHGCLPPAEHDGER